jgi:hypothetical protein
MVRRRGDSGKSWLTFLQNHRDAIVPLDFFTASDSNVLAALVVRFFFLYERRSQLSTQAARGTIGTRRKRERQQDLWIATGDVVQTPGNAFYDRLNGILAGHKFDQRVEHLCRKFYKSQYGRPSMTPGVYFRALLHSAIGFVTPADMLAGRQKQIHAARDHKLEEARRQRQLRQQRPAA